MLVCRIGKGFKDIPLAIALTKRVRFCILASMGAGLKKEIVAAVSKRDKGRRTVKIKGMTEEGRKKKVR